MERKKTDMTDYTEKPLAFVEPKHHCTKQITELAKRAARKHNVFLSTPATFEVGHPQVVLLNLARGERRTAEGRRIDSDNSCLGNMMQKDMLKGVYEIYIEQRGEEEFMDRVRQFCEVVQIRLKDEDDENANVDATDADEELKDSLEEEKKPKDVCKEISKEKKMAKKEEIIEVN